jgi:hypothetical protein
MFYGPDGKPAAEPKILVVSVQRLSICWPMLAACRDMARERLQRSVCAMWWADLGVRRQFNVIGGDRIVAL